MPAWDDWGEMLKDGLQGLVIQIAYILPGVLVYFVGILVYFIASFGLSLLFSAPRAGSEGGPSAPLLMFILFFAIMAILFLTMLLAIALMILGAIPLPVALAHFSAKGDLSAAFRVKEWWPLLRANRLGYFIAWVIIIGLISMLYSVLVPIYSALYFTLFLMPFLMIASFILFAPLYLYLSMLVAALYGRTYWESVALAEGQAGEA
jgi:hypothetical protein